MFIAKLFFSRLLITKDLTNNISAAFADTAKIRMPMSHGGRLCKLYSVRAGAFL